MLTLSERINLQLDREKTQRDDYRIDFWNKINRSLKNDSTPSGAEGKLIRIKVMELREHLKAFIKDDIESKLPYKTRKLGPFFRGLTDDDLSVVSYIAIYGIMNSNNASLQSLCKYIGNGVIEELNILTLARMAQGEHTGTEIMKRVKSRRTPWAKKRYLAYMAYTNIYKGKDAPPDFDYKDDLRFSFENNTKISIGATIVDIAEAKLGLFRLSKMPHKPGKAKGSEYVYRVSINPEVLDMVKDMNQSAATIGFNTYPMLCPPREWTSFNCGGYLSSQKYIIRLNQGMDLKKIKSFYAAERNNKAPKVIEALNIIQSTPWRINQRILDIILEVAYWKNPPSCFPSPEIPGLPEPPEDMTDEAKIRAWRLEVFRHRQRYASMIGERIGLEINIRSAKDNAGYDKIWFPHNIDFRGRVYPIPSFNYQGSDVARGLLCFADGDDVKNDIEARRWLKRNLANLYGLDKKLFHEREAWVDQNMALLRRIDQDPAGNFRDWQDADSPVQFLAATIDYIGVVDRGKLSYIKIGMDGSCSGLQHYSAMFRDEVGGAAVNLIPDPEKIHDIYGIISDKVVDVLKHDAEFGFQDEKHPETGNVRVGPQTMALEWLAYGVDRKVVKRPVMTYVYGSVAYGMSNHVFSDIIIPEIMSRSEGDDNFNQTWRRPRQSAIYIGKLINDSVANTVIKAKQAMDWLQSVASRTNRKNCEISWKSPSGLRVYQGYAKSKSEIIDCVFRQSLSISGRLRMTYKNTDEGLDHLKQRNAIAPNFIHSVDAAHVHLFALKANEYGIRNLGIIHDDFGCSAKHAAKMAIAIRESFIEMHKQDIAGNFKKALDFFLIDDPPVKGALDINAVADSPYCFH